MKGLILFVAFTVTPGMLPGCSPQQQSASTIPVTRPKVTSRSGRKPPFEIVDLRDFPVSSRNGEVVLHFFGDGDPVIPNYRLLATMIWSDKKSQVFQLKHDVSVGSSSNVSVIRYNRRKKMLTAYGERSMAGPGVLSEGMLICRNVTDAVIFKTAARAARAAREDADNIIPYGCICQAIDLKSKKRPK